MKSESGRVSVKIGELLESDIPKLTGILWDCDPDIHAILSSGDTLEDTRKKMFNYLNNVERHLYDIYSDKSLKDMNLLEKNNSKECIRILKNIIRTENEMISNFSALQSLYSAAKG